MGGFMKRARIDLTTSTAIDRKMSDRFLLLGGRGQRIFTPKGVMKDAPKVLELL